MLAGSPFHTEARVAYDAFAPHYDRYTTGYGHNRWVARLEKLARLHGLAGRRALDVACGTGRSSLPLVRLGYRVEACDVSPKMIARARRRLAGGAGSVFVADMRDLPAIGPYDLVTCLNDAVDYLLSDDDLEAAMRSFAAVLAPRGVIVFDVNSLLTYRTAFAGRFAEEIEGELFWGRGDASPEAPAGGVFDMEIGVGSATVTRHRQRHQTRERLAGAAAAAGLEIVAVRGQQPGARIQPDVDESRDTKVLYVLRHAET
jgi:SAM-dependent methyltransferase